MTAASNNRLIKVGV